MADFRITKIIARQVLDSRGNPTLEAEVFTASGSATAIVPSGASTGSKEALELRDNDPKLFLGKSVYNAVKNAGILGEKLKGIDVRKQEEIDKLMIKEDGTKNKSKYGANAILAISLACARLAAKLEEKPLYKYLSELAGTKPRFPIPFANIINGGKHAGSKLKFQEFMIVPKDAKTFEEATRITVEVYHNLKSIIGEKYGKSATNVGDEGGFAPNLDSAKEALELITQAIDKAGYKGKAFIAMDCAASEFFNGKEYEIPEKMNGRMMVDFYLNLLQKYSIMSIEDPFHETDYESFRSLTAKAGSRILIIGDDLLVSNPEIIKKGIAEKWCTALLLKVNQIGTLTEAISAAKLAMSAGWKVIVSHRSGETEDTFIADLAYGLGCGAIKLGAPCRTDRTCKYNQLLRIEESIRNRH